MLPARLVHHAHALGYRTDDTDAGIENGLAFLGTSPSDADALLDEAAYNELIA